MLLKMKIEEKVFGKIKITETLFLCINESRGEVSLGKSLPADPRSENQPRGLTLGAFPFPGYLDQTASTS